MSDRCLKLKGSFELRRKGGDTVLVYEKDLPAEYDNLEDYLKALLEECWASATGVAPPSLQIVNVPLYDVATSSKIGTGGGVKFYPTNILIEDDNSSKEYHAGDVAELIGVSYNVEFLAGDDYVVLDFTAHNVTPGRWGERVSGPLAAEHWDALASGVSRMLDKGLDSDSVYNISQLTKDAKGLIETQISPVGDSRVVVESKMLSNFLWRSKTRLATSVKITDAGSGEVVFQRSLDWDHVSRLIRKLNIN